MTAALLLLPAHPIEAASDAPNAPPAMSPGDPDTGGNDPQPTEAEEERLLERSGNDKGDVDTSPAIGKEVDQLYRELMKKNTPGLEGTGPQ